MNHYPSNLTDNQWQVIEKFLDVQVRNRKYSLRSIVNAINYLLKTGCLWRMLPMDFLPYNLVYYYFSKWKNEGVFDELFFKLHTWLHVMLGRAKCPSLGLIDSRSVKTSHHVKTTFGVDTLGIPLAIVVHEANINDSVGALQVFEDMRFKFPRLAKIIADGGYRGKLLSDTLKATLGCELEVVLRPDECPSKFQVMPKRWIVEILRLVGKL